MTKTKTRNLLRKRFIELHIELLRSAFEAMNERHKNGTWGKLSEQEKVIAELMRKKIGYSCKTAMTRRYLKQKPKQIGHTTYNLKEVLFSSGMLSILPKNRAAKRLIKFLNIFANVK